MSVIAPTIRATTVGNASSTRTFCSRSQKMTDRPLVRPRSLFCDAGGPAKGTGAVISAVWFMGSSFSSSAVLRATARYMPESLSIQARAAHGADGQTAEGSHSAMSEMRGGAKDRRVPDDGFPLLAISFRRTRRKTRLRRREPPIPPAPARTSPEPDDFRGRARFGGTAIGNIQVRSRAALEWAPRQTSNPRVSLCCPEPLHTRMRQTRPEPDRTKSGEGA
jgi:hypothetical protein